MTYLRCHLENVGWSGTDRATSGPVFSSGLKVLRGGESGRAGNRSMGATPGGPTLHLAAQMVRLQAWQGCFDHDTIVNPGLTRPSQS